MKPKQSPWGKRIAALAAVAGGALLFAQPAKADSLSIALNLGGGGYYHAYEPVVYHRPVVQHVVYRPAPVRVAKVIYRDKDVHRGKHWHKGRGHGHGHDRRYGGWHGGHRVAYGYR